MLRKFKCPYCGMPFEIHCIFEMIIINLKIYFFLFFNVGIYRNSMFIMLYYIYYNIFEYSKN